MAAAISIDAQDLLYQVHHVFLPPRLPQEDDFDASQEHQLLENVLGAMERFREYIQGSAKFEAAIRMIRTMMDYRPDSSLASERVRAALQDLDDGGSLGFHLRSQNFGLLVARRGKAVRFEGFELLAMNSSVIGCKGRLRRTFPATCVDIDLHQFHDPPFQAMLADLLCQLDATTHASCRPKVKKAGKHQHEERDTVDPRLLALVTGLLRGLGRQAEPEQILKHSREEVLWHNTKNAWHRSAGWLFLRLTLQLVLDRGCAAGRRLFKQFMAFFMGVVLQQAVSTRLASHLLHCMQAKVSRRCLKLLDAAETGAAHPLWMSHTSEAMQSASSRLHETWSLVQEDASRTVDLSGLQQLRPSLDVTLSLGKLKPYLDWVSDPARYASSSTTAVPADGFRFQRAVCPSILPSPSFHGPADVYLELADFENWVAENLQCCPCLTNASTSTCQQLSSLVGDYHSAAAVAYSQNPVNLSVMWLTIMELWVALDGAVVAKYPLLLQHRIGFPAGLLEPLTLPDKAQMVRLQKVEDYVSERERRARADFPSAFGGFGDPNSFATRSYQVSEEHQAVHREILQSAERQRAAKLEELRSSKSLYDNLKNRHDDSTHDDHRVPTRCGWRRCRKKCIKCKLQKEMSRMRISVHEWPLPSKECKARAVVFELRVPRPILWWRKTTMKLLIDAFKGWDTHNSLTTSATCTIYYAQEYCDLKQFVSGVGGDRLQLGSTVKPFTTAHYADLQVSEADTSKVCQSHGCQYDYYDRHHSLPVGSFVGNPVVPRTCSFAHLSNFAVPDWIRSFTHSSNEVVAAQSRCPQDMTLDEFKTFGHVRSGVRLQWRNMLTELMIPSVDLNKTETALLFLQASYHAGPCTDQTHNAVRDAHSVLANDEFGKALLHGLRTALARIQENWESDVAMLVLCRLCARLLSCSAGVRVQEECLVFLERVRSLSRRWVTVILRKWSDSTSPEAQQDLNRRILMMALLCASTYDVGNRNLARLFSADEATTCFIEVSILIHDHRQPHSSGGSPLVPVGLQLWQRLCYHAQEAMTERIKLSQHSLDQAVRTFWHAYEPGPEPWFQTDTKTRSHILQSVSSGGLLVCLNLLDATLLVNGSPLSRLPSEYLNHATYSRLFGTRTLEIVPSDQNGMRYSGTRKQNGWTVHFAMMGENLVIRARMGDSTWEFIPPSKLVGDFPTTFVNCYSHWLDTDSGVVEFRPLGEPWRSGGDLWRTCRTSTGMTLCRGDLRLVDINSKTATTLAAVFEPIEEASFVNTFLNITSGTLDINLCRYDLAFTLEAQSCAVRSKHYRGMSVDQCQDVQTLVGLETRLVLCPEKASRNDMKAVIIPQGAVSSRKGMKGHPVSRIDSTFSTTFVTQDYSADISRRKHECYRIDTELGRLVDNGSLQSKLFLCHLHASTAHCLPDQLTGRTGTEEALRILKSAAVASFEQLTKDDALMLSAISQMSPKRLFYPNHLTVMQSITWSPAHYPLAQNDEFVLAVRSLLHKASTYALVFPDAPDVAVCQDTKKDLAERALIRDSAFRVSGYGAEHHTVRHDKDYEGRISICIAGSELGKLESRVRQMTRNLLAGKPYLLVSPSVSPQTLYDVIGGEADGIISPGTEVTCKFDHGWLDPPSGSIGRRWCRIQEYLSLVDRGRSKYDLMAFFGALAFAQEADMQVIQLLLAFTCAPELRALQQPQHSLFTLLDGHRVQETKLKQEVGEHKRDISSCPESNLAAYTDEDGYSLNNRREEAWRRQVENTARSFVSDLAQQWPVRVPTQPYSNLYMTYFDVTAAMVPIRDSFASWYRNLELDGHFRAVISALNNIEVDPVSSFYVAMGTNTSPFGTAPARTHLSISDLFAQQAPVLQCRSPSGLEAWCKPASMTQDGTDSCGTSRSQEPRDGLTPPLRELLGFLRSQATRKHQHDYVDELQVSCESSNPEADGTVELLHEESAIRARLEQHLQLCSSQTESFQHELSKHLRSFQDRFGVASSEACFPRLSPIFLLEQMSRRNWGKLPTAWRQCIVQWAVSLTHVQRAQRMLDAAGNASVLLKEIKTVGHRNWDPMEFPESLLLEVESGLMIRDVQESIAAPMRNSAGNCCMQLNMGEGKSSVIVPIVAASMANGKQLVRIIVAKPQSKQMRHMLTTKLGGLLDRRLFFLPFSRSIKMDDAKALQIQQMLTTCMETGGVLLVQPEHLLSFGLMGIEHAASAGRAGDVSHNSSTGRQLIEVQKFMDAHCRDIIDEVDENLNVKFELIYTIGAQGAIELSPDRWRVIQCVLGLVQKYAPAAKMSDPDGIELIELKTSGHSGQFWSLRILNASAAQLLLPKVARHVCEHGIHGLATGHQSPDTRDSVFAYITEASLDDKMASPIEEDETGFFSDATKRVLLLLRGLFAGGVLAFAFGQKRWRVNYGLAARTPPTMLAVPYRAKDSPAPRAEFSHPDIVITLTCLSYYYGGLSNDELDTCFEQLKRSDQAENEFACWAAGSPTLPQAFRQLGGINLKDREQCLEHVFPALRLSKAVVDFYLHTIVFPKEMVEFPEKLSSSGWDLAKPKVHPVTGFSGTCDSKYVLPLDIQHLDLPEQWHTNATLLGCLLHPENSIKNLDAGIDGLSLLKAAVSHRPSIDVILDVGAQIIDMGNLEVARMWLELVDDVGKQAAIFVNDEDELLVVNRQGYVEPFLTSSYAGHTDACLVFLDEAHTRGIDIKLPDHYRAAATLGPRLTKDRLAQACMRMRKLGKGQYVVFFIPHEIQQRIRHCNQLPDEDPLTVTDMLCWTVSETWQETERSIPLWALQGLRYQHQQIIWKSKIGDRCSGTSFNSADLKEYFEAEAMSLEQRYRPKGNKASQLFGEKMKDPRLVARRTQIEMIKNKCERFEVLSFNSATLQEEQERELAPELEQERQTENPPPVEACIHTIHPDVRRLVRLGILQTSGGGILPAFGSLAQSSVAKLAKIDPGEFGSDLLVTTDFSKTVRLGPDSCSDAFHRPVHWIMSLCKSPSGKRLVILSPWEADKLLPEIEKSSHVHLHCYVPRPNLAFPSLQDLKLFPTPSLQPGWTTPRETVVQLKLFAADLYFTSADEYRQTCAYLGLSCMPNDGSVQVALDGFVGRGTIYPRCGFTRSPTSFLRMLMAGIRRNRQDISKTHVGRMLAGEILAEREFADMA